MIGLPSLISHHSYQAEWSMLLMGPTGTQYIMYHRYMTGLHCSFYCFIGPFIVLHESFSRPSLAALHPGCPSAFKFSALCNRCPFIYFCMCMGLFWRDPGHTAGKEEAARKIRNGAPPLVAAVAAETPRRKWRIGRTLIQFNV